MFEFVVFDCLLALRRGHELTRLGESAMNTVLPGAPFAYVAFGYLRRNALIWPMHDGDDPCERWVLSNRGYAVFCRMEAWYRTLPFHLRLLGRLGLAEGWIMARTRACEAGRVWEELA